MSETTSETVRPSHEFAGSQFFNDYGMLFVLLLLCLLFSLTTLKQQHPTGAAAGTQVAQKIIAAGHNNVIIVARDTNEDREFTQSATSALESSGKNLLATVNGGPADVRRAIEAAMAANQTIDAIAANNVTARWNVYDRFDQVGSQKCVTPEPYRWPDFLKMSNILGVANQTAIYAIIAIGMTMVIITGGIDLGVGSLVALSAVTAALILRDYGGGTEANVGWVVLASLTGVLICATSGLFVGQMVTRFQLPPFIVTLGIMMMASGLAFRLTNGQSIPELPKSFFWLGGKQTLGVPNPVWLMAGLYIVAHIVMSRTVFGRYVYAIGGNEEASRLSGVPVRRVLMIVYTICGALAGLGGIVLASQLAAGDPKFGTMYELEVIAAVVVGGTSLMGGSGKIFGTLIGAFIIAVIKNGMNLMNVEPFNQRIVLGAVLLTAVLLDQLKRRR